MAEKRKNIFERIFLGSRRVESVGLTPAIATDKPNELLIRELYTTQKELLNSTNVNTEDEAKLLALYKQMDTDAIISAALDLYADNSTQVNFKTGHVVAVESSDKDFERELNAFLWESVKIDTEAWQIVRDVARDGKVLLDTKVDMSDWSFVPVEDPSKVNALSYGQDKIRYFVVEPDKTNESDTGMYNAVYGMDARDKTNYSIEPKDRFIAGFNSREILGKMFIATKSEYQDDSEVEPEELLIRSGRSSLASVVQVYQTLSALEDALFINRLTKSTAFKVVSVDVSNSNNKQAKQIMDSVKSAFKSSESIDLKNARYQNRQSPIPIADFIYVPHKGEKGTVSIEEFGGEVGEAKIADIDYYRNKLFAGLGMLKAYLGFEETTPGGLGEATLSKLDERFGRKILRFQAVLRAIIDQMISYYWRYSSTTREIDSIPEYKVILGKVSTKEEEENRKRVSDSLDLAVKFIGLTKEEAFKDKIDPEKLFKYVFNHLVGIDTSLFDTQPEPEEIDVKIHKIKEDIKTIAESKGITNLDLDLEQFREELEAGNFKPINRNNTGVLTGTFKQFIETSRTIFENMFKNEDIFVEDEEGNEIPFYEAIRRYRYKKVFGEASYKDLKDTSKSKDPQRLAKSKKSVAKYTGIDDDNNITFQITAEDPEKNIEKGLPTSYTTKVALKDFAQLLKDRKDGETDKSLVMSAIQGDIAVSCTCPAAKWWGQQYNGTKGDYSLDKNDIAPTVRIPTQPLCKHTILTLTVLPFWYNTIVRDLRNNGAIPSAKIEDEKIEDQKDKNKKSSEAEELEQLEKELD